MKQKLNEFEDTGLKVKNFLVSKLEKNWKRVTEKMNLQKTSAEDFENVHFFI